VGARAANTVRREKKRNRDARDAQRRKADARGEGVTKIADDGSAAKRRKAFKPLDHEAIVEQEDLPTIDEKFADSIKTLCGVKGKIAHLNDDRKWATGKLTKSRAATQH